MKKSYWGKEPHGEKERREGEDDEVSPAALQAGLNAVVFESLKPAAFGLGVLMLVFTFSHLVFLPGEIKFILAAAAGATSLGMLGLFAYLQARPLPSALTYPLAVGVAGVTVLNTLLHLVLGRDPEQTTYLILSLIGAGFLILSTPWFTALVSVALAGWVLAMTTLPAGTNWLKSAFALLAAVLLVALIHLGRVRATARLERLRIRDARYKNELEVVLKSTEEAQRSLATSMAVGQRVTSILDLDVLLNQVAALLQERFHCYYVGIFMLDESGETIIARAGTGKAGRALCDQGFRLRVGQEGITGWVADHRRAACVEDVFQDSRYVPHELVPNTRSELALPLEMGASLLGVLDMQSDQASAFREEIVPVLQMLADQVAIAINNALLYQGERARRVLTETLYEVGRALSGTLNQTEVFDLILKHIAEIVPYDRAAVMLRSGDDSMIVASRGFPPGLQTLHLPIRPGDVFDEVYRGQKPLSIPDVLQRQNWQHVADLAQARAWLGVPLIHAGEVFGMLSLTREIPDAYKDEEITLAATFASQAAIALHNARLYEQVTRATQNLEVAVNQRTDALQKAYDQLSKLDRTKSDFISIASHELRTPLTLLQGYGQMLLDDGLIKANPVQFHHVKGIMTGADRLNDIIEAMIDIAKIDSRDLRLYPVPVSIQSMIRSVCDSFHLALQERQLTLLDELPVLPHIEADLDALRKVIHHLIVNAIKYTPDGGAITVSGWALQPGVMDLPEGGLEIVISDTGIGIDPSARDLIFMKFYQTGRIALHSSGKTKFKGGGPGLGLAISKGIVEAHGGKIWVESPGFDEKRYPGSHFHVVLPLRAKRVKLFG